MGDKSTTNVADFSVNSNSTENSTTNPEDGAPQFTGMYRRAPTHVEVELEDYFKGPRVSRQFSFFPFGRRTNNTRTSTNIQNGLTFSDSMAVSFPK